MLSPTEIKVELLRRGMTTQELAQKWSVPRETVSRVIHRDGNYVYPEVRRKLARFLGVSVADIGREPIRKPKRKAA